MDGLLCGIDPGLHTTGYAVLDTRGDAVRIVEAGVCKTDAKLALSDRLCQLHRDMTSILEQHQPVVMAVEELYAHHRYPRTSILMGHARGVILCTAARLGISVISFSATHVKRYLTGHGQASKAQMQRAIRLTLGLDSDPEPADVADALAIGLCCAGGGPPRFQPEGRNLPTQECSP